MSICHLANVNHLGLIYIFFAKSQISLDGVVEHHRFLLHNSNDVSKPFDIQLSHIDSIQTDTALFCFVESGQQGHRSTLSTTTLSNQCNSLSRIDGEVETV